MTDGPDFGAIKMKQQAAWATGDYAVVGSSIVIVPEMLCEAMDLRSGWKVLDVAAGSGNASLAAARRGCRVTSTDYVPTLLERGRVRAEAEGFRIAFEEADAEHLPFADGAFDAVISTVGVMFAPDQARAAAEMVRVCRAGGGIRLANWTPGGFVGQMFQCIGKYFPPATGLRSPFLWGTEEGLKVLFPEAGEIRIEVKHLVMRSTSPAEWLEMFRMYYGPLNRTFAALDETQHARFTADLLGLVGSLNRAEDGTMVVPSEYLEVVVSKF